VREDDFAGVVHRGGSCCACGEGGRFRTHRGRLTEGDDKPARGGCRQRLCAASRSATLGPVMTEGVMRRAEELAGSGGLPAFVYDLGALREHVAAIRKALTGGPELFYAAKANPDAEILK